jgi:hypothetical protein
VFAPFPSPPRDVCAASAEDTNWGRELSTTVIRVGAGVLMVHNGEEEGTIPVELLFSSGIFPTVQLYFLAKRQVVRTLNSSAAL